MATNIRFSDVTTVLAMNGCWPLKPDHVHPIVSKLFFRYQEVAELERLIAQVRRCQDDEAFRQTPRNAEIRLLHGRLEELERLLQTIKVDRQSDWQAAERIVAFEKKLMQRATGGSINALYNELPQELRGVVELAYDSHNNPSLRLYEKMLYADGQYDASRQGYRFFVKTNDAEYLPVRLPTPETEIALRVPFDDAAPKARRSLLMLLTTPSAMESSSSIARARR